MFYILSDNRSIWVALVSTILITLAFLVIGSILRLTFLDTISDPSEVRLALASMPPNHRVFHVWITLTLDVLYPLSYGALFVGLTFRFYMSYGRLLAAPFFVLVPADLLEGVVQVLALTDMADFIGAKAILTPLKYGLVVYGVITITIGTVLCFFSHAGNSRKRNLDDSI